MGKLKYACLICGQIIDDAPPGFNEDPLVCLLCAVEEDEEEQEDWLTEGDPEDDQ